MIKIWFMVWTYEKFISFGSLYKNFKSKVYILEEPDTVLIIVGKSNKQLKHKMWRSQYIQLVFKINNKKDIEKGDS